MKTLHSRKVARAMQNPWVRVRQLMYDIAQRVAGVTVLHVCESHGNNAYFANALDWGVAQERQAMVAEHAKKEEDCLSDLHLSMKVVPDEVPISASSGRRAW